MTRPRPYRVTKKRYEHATTYIWATSAKEAERIARDSYDIEWDFSPGSQVGPEKAELLRGSEVHYFGKGASGDPELLDLSTTGEKP